MAKPLATVTGLAIVDRALQIHGSYGYLQNGRSSVLSRDLRDHSIVEDSDDVRRMIAAQEMMKQ